MVCLSGKKSGAVADDCLEPNGTFFSVRFPDNNLVPRNTRPTISSSTSSEKSAYVIDNNFNERSQNNAKDSHIRVAIEVMIKTIERLD